MKMKKEKVLMIVFCILLPIVLLLLSYKIVLGLVVLTGFQQETVDFLQGEKELDLEYTLDEFSHLEDVKKVMGVFDYLFYFGLLVVTLIVTYYRKNEKQLNKLFFYGGIVTGGFVLVKLFFSLVAFDWAFKIFHEIFFPQGNWRFPSDSLLIQTFPGDFFMGMAMKIFFLALVLASFFILGSILWKKRGSR